MRNSNPSASVSWESEAERRPSSNKHNTQPGRRNGPAIPETLHEKYQNNLMQPGPVVRLCIYAHSITIGKRQGVENGSNEKNLSHHIKQSPGIDWLTGTHRVVAAPIVLSVLMSTMHPVLAILRIRSNISTGSWLSDQFPARK